MDIRESPFRRPGRAPRQDDVCAQCEFELGSFAATATMAYNVLRDAPRGHGARQLVTVHYCPRHATEVQPLSAGPWEGGGFPLTLSRV